MAIDLMVDDRGDFFLGNMEQYPRLVIDWVDSTQPTLRIDFEQGEEQIDMEPKKNQFCIDFVTAQVDRSLNAKAPAVTDIQEIRQRIMIRLRTERGEMKLKPNFGSYLVTQRHEDIMSDQVQSMVKTIVMAEVSDILDSPNVVVKPKKKTGPFYCQNLNVYVYDNDELIFDIEV